MNFHSFHAFWDLLGLGYRKQVWLGKEGQLGHPETLAVALAQVLLRHVTLSESFLLPEHLICRKKWLDRIRGLCKGFCLHTSKGIVKNDIITSLSIFHHGFKKL
jgi:hypothetical protein